MERKIERFPEITWPLMAPSEGCHEKNAACGWSAVQLYSDEGQDQWRAIYGTTEAALEIQNTIKRAEGWAFL